MLTIKSHKIGSKHAMFVLMVTEREHCDVNGYLPVCKAGLGATVQMSHICMVDNLLRYFCQHLMQTVIHGHVDKPQCAL